MIRPICAAIFQATGWTYKNSIPDELRSFVMIGAPHTSNYDFIPAMTVALKMKRHAHFVIKKEWLRFPLNILFKPIGAIGLDRTILKSKSVNTTDLMADLFKLDNEFVLMISPEGTRGPVKTWKTGFYYIAQKAGVPIVLGYADYHKKEAGLGMVIYPHNFEEDMNKIMNFYQSMRGKISGNFILDDRFTQGDRT